MFLIIMVIGIFIAFWGLGVFKTYEGTSKLWMIGTLTMTIGFVIAFSPVLLVGHTIIDLPGNWVLDRV